LFRDCGSLLDSLVQVEGNVRVRGQEDDWFEVSERRYHRAEQKDSSRLKWRELDPLSQTPGEVISCVSSFIAKRLKGIAKSLRCGA